MPALGQRFYRNKLPSDLSHDHFGVVHYSVLDGDVTHHQTQAVQLQFQLVIRHARGRQGVQKLLGEEVTQMSMVF